MIHIWFTFAKVMIKL